MTLEEVYREHFRFVWRVLRRLGVPESDVQDATQDVFLVVHRKLAEFEGRSQLRTWLFSICLGVARNRRRKPHHRYEVAGAMELDEHADASADQDAQAQRRQGLALLESLLEQIDLDQRVVFTLFELEGMTGEEMAEMLGIPLGTVYSRLRQGREAFRQAHTRARAAERFLELRPQRHGGTP